jgi:thiol-disulfide isomerase/thioredoxin
MKGLDEIKGRYANGTNVKDDPSRAPTGSAYQVPWNKTQYKDNDTTKQKIQQQSSSTATADRLDAFITKQDENDSCDGDSDDEYYDKLLDEVEKDPELLRIRQQRLEELRSTQIQRAENLSKGHGQYRLIHQDEFLPECTGSEWVVAHFFHQDFQRCKIMDHHLQIVAEEHIECKFVRINADKAPFFVHKLKVKTLPTVIVFQNGLVVDRLIGFEGLSVDPSEPDKWHTGKLQTWLGSTGAIKYTPPREEVLEEMKRLGLQEKGTIWGNDQLFDDDD